MIWRGAGEAPVSYGQEAFAGGWAVFDRNGVLAAQYNASSVTDNGTGDFTVNWAIAFASTSYAVVGCAQDVGTAGSNNSAQMGISTDNFPTTTSVRVNVCNNTGGAKDAVFMYVLAVGRR